MTQFFPPKWMFWEINNYVHTDFIKQMKSTSVCNSHCQPLIMLEPIQQVWLSSDISVSFLNTGSHFSQQQKDLKAFVAFLGSYGTQQHGIPCLSYDNWSSLNICSRKCLSSHLVLWTCACLLGTTYGTTDSPPSHRRFPLTKVSRNI